MDACPKGGDHSPVVINKDGKVTVVCSKCKQTI